MSKGDDSSILWQPENLSYAFLWGIEMFRSRTAVGGRWLGRKFSALSLSNQFALAGGLIMVLTMAVAGYFVSAIVSKIAIERTAASTALFVDSLVAPLIQELATEDVLEKKSAASIEEMIGATHFQERFPHLDIWKRDGLVAHSTAPSLIGRKFPLSAELVAAFNGDVSARYTDLNAGEHVLRGFRRRFLEVYIPIRSNRSGQIIAVAEIHEIVEPLERELWRVRSASWLSIVSATLLIMLSLFTVVFRGSRLIAAQQEELCKRIEEIERISDQNVILKDRAQNASGRLSEMTEGYLRKVGAELHDGPGQLIGFARLRIEHVRRAGTTTKREEELRQIDSALAESLGSIRAMARGLMLPEVESLSISKIVDRVVRIHEMRTGTKVGIHCNNSPRVLSQAENICLYRFLQEGLNNAVRHAEGEGQSVFCHAEGSMLKAVVQDSGKRGESKMDTASVGLGLIGLRERIESLGGTFRVQQNSGNGTRIEMVLSIAEMLQDE